MRIRGEDPGAAVPPVMMEGFPGNITNGQPFSANSGFPTSDTANSSQGIKRQKSVAKADGPPDYFAPSTNIADDSTSQSLTPSTASDHPWASLFPNGAAGAMTSMPRAEPSGPFGPSSSSFSMSASSSSNGGVFKRASANSKLKNAMSFNSTSTSSLHNLADDLSKYTPIEALELATILSSATASTSSSILALNESILVIDIRPSTSFVSSRIQGSINLCAPSTLLKRAGVSAEKIEEEMLGSTEDRLKFSGWKRGPQKDGTKQTSQDPRIPTIEQVVVLDTDTTEAGSAGKPAAGGGGPCLIGLLRKFDQAGYAGKLQWLVGGFSTFSKAIETNKKKHPAYSQLVDSGPIRPAEEGESHPVDRIGGEEKGIFSMLKRTESQRRSSAPTGQGGTMSMDAALTTPQRQYSLVQPRGLPMEAFSLSTTTQRANAEKDRKPMQSSSSHPTMDIGGQAAIGESGVSACANPFFDNIRQNRELQHGITERIPLELPSMSAKDLNALPIFLRDLVEMEDQERTEVLAKKFFDIEKAEQRRLIATMQQHAAESTLTGQEGTKRERLIRRISGSTDALQLSSAYCSVSAGKNCDNSSEETFPFSIAAALERGSENRYNNIWTFEHSRIRCADPSEYLNGSYLEPAKEYGCLRRYIATQAPLPTTFATFWNVIWQQDVRVICMITREFESGRVQSHNYWKDATYGDVQVAIVSEEYLDASGKVLSQPEEGSKKATEDDNDGGHMFPSTRASTDGASKSAHTVRRRFLVTKGQEQREMVQLQFIAWPDYSIPDDAVGLLQYISLANSEQHAAEMQIKKKGSGVGPLLVHCSAGVGRTGTYIVIDSVLDVLRRRRLAKTEPFVVTDIWDDQVSGSIQGDTTMISPNSSSTPLPSLSMQPRRSLKRELSPSAMDIDSGEGERKSSQGSSGGQGGFLNSKTSASRLLDSSSPPSSRRGRSDETEEMPSFKLAAIASPRRGSNNGVETPSGAMGSMRIAWDSPLQTPPRSKETRPTAPSLSVDGMVSPTSTPASLATNNIAVPPSTSVESQDLVQRIVETIREQRMSTVQTARQYVFAYRAVIEGILLETQKEHKGGQ